MNEECYHTSDKELLSACLKGFGVSETLQYFHRLGLMTKDRNGYVYPLAEQAAVVVDVLRHAVRDSGVHLCTESRVVSIRPAREKKGTNGGSFQICWESAAENAHGKREAVYDKVILTCGSKAAPKTGSDGCGYEFAKVLGHTIVPVVPSLVQLKCSDSFCKALSGIRAECRIHIYEEERLLNSEEGEIQLTDYGISGIPVFQLSGQVNKRLLDKRHGQLRAEIDFLSDCSEGAFRAMIRERLAHTGELTVEEFFVGVLNKKLMMLFIRQAGLNPAEKASCADRKKLNKVFSYCKKWVYHIADHNGFENAQVCSGGVSMREVTSQMESKKVPGLYFAGEVLDVDGRCGGYNLQWAWTSGIIAGRGAAQNSGMKSRGIIQ